MLADLDKQVDIHIFGAERPFLLQCMAAFLRLGRHVEALCLSEEAQQLISKLSPKYKLIKSINDDQLKNISGRLIWAPQDALFKNETLNENELSEIVGIDKNYSGKIILCLPHSSFEQIQTQPPFKNEVTCLYFPPLVGFGDNNYFSALLNSILECASFDNPPTSLMLSFYDAISIVVSVNGFVKNPKFNNYWIEGTVLEGKHIEAGFEDFKKTKANSLQFIFRKMLQKDKYQYALQEARKNPSKEKVCDHNDYIPSGYTPWIRFLRDAYRTYQSTPAGQTVLHFMPIKGPQDS